MAVMWNDDLDRKFKEMNGTTSVQEMAAYFGTTVGAIYARRRVISALVQPHKRVSDDDLRAIGNLVAEGLSQAAIARKTGISAGRVSHMLDRAGLKAKPAMKKYTLDDALAGHMRRLVADGKCLQAIAAETHLPGQKASEFLKALGLKVSVAADNRGAAGVKARAEARVRPLSKAKRPFDDDERAQIEEMLGKVSARKMAKILKTSESVLRQRARLSAIVLGGHIRSPRAALTADLLRPLAEKGLVLSAAARELRRDSRTLAAAAAELGIEFRKSSKRREDRPKGAATVPKRCALSEKKVTQKKPVEKRLKEVVARPVRPATQPVFATNGAPVKVPKPVVLAKIDLTPADRKPTRESTAEEVKQRRWGAQTFSFRSPSERVVFRQEDVDAAVARFIAERGVTRLPAAGDDCLVARARRMGYVVLKMGKGYLIDGKTNLPSEASLADFVKQRERKAIAA